jgi:hypothetical protein
LARDSVEAAKRPEDEVEDNEMDLLLATETI